MTFVNPIEFTWHGLELTFVPSKYMNSFEDFWRIRALIGSDDILNFLKKENIQILNEENIIKILKDSKYKFYTDKNENVLSASDNELMRKRFGKLIELSIFDAIEKYGIELVENTREKGYSDLP